MEKKGSHFSDGLLLRFCLPLLILCLFSGCPGGGGGGGGSAAPAESGDDPAPSSPSPSSALIEPETVIPGAYAPLLLISPVSSTFSERPTVHIEEQGGGDVLADTRSIRFGGLDAVFSIESPRYVSCIPPLWTGAARAVDIVIETHRNGTFTFPDAFVYFPEIALFEVQKTGSMVTLSWEIAGSGGERDIQCGSTFLGLQDVLEENKGVYEIDLDAPESPLRYGIYEFRLSISVEGMQRYSPSRELDVGVLAWDGVPLADGYLLYPQQRDPGSGATASLPAEPPPRDLCYDIGAATTRVRLKDLYDYGLISKGCSYRFAVKSYIGNPDLDYPRLTTSDWSNSVSCSEYHVEVME